MESEAGKVMGSEAERVMGSETGKVVGNDAERIMGSEAGKVVGNDAERIMGSEAGKVVGNDAERIMGSEAEKEMESGREKPMQNKTGSKEGDMEIELGNEMGNRAGQLQGVVSRHGEKRLLGEMECMGFYNVIQENRSGWQDTGILGKNEVVLEFGAQSRNEGFARMVAAAFAAQMNPTMEEISDIKTAVSEAVTNAVIHGYEKKNGMIRMRLAIEEDEIQIEVSDRGIGMENVLKAMEPLYTTRPDMERSGMGFAFMEAFMDELEVHSRLNFGTVVRMKKKITASDELPEQME